MTNILALDVSTSCTGVTILSEKGPSLIEALDFKNKNKFPTLFSKANRVREYLHEINKNFIIDKIAIEAALHMFRPGASSAVTISTLMKFNGIVSWIAFDEFQKEPEYVSATSARKRCGIKIPKGVKAKLAVMETLKTDPLFQPYIKLTRTGSISPHVYDMADAYIIGKSLLTS